MYFFGIYCINAFYFMNVFLSFQIMWARVPSPDVLAASPHAPHRSLAAVGPSIVMGGGGAHFIFLYWDSFIFCIPKLCIDLVACWDFPPR